MSWRITFICVDFRYSQQAQFIAQSQAISTSSQVLLATRSAPRALIQQAVTSSAYPVIRARLTTPSVSQLQTQPHPVVYAIYSEHSQPLSQQQQQPTQQVTITSNAKNTQRLAVQREQLQQQQRGVVFPPAAVFSTIVSPVRPATSTDASSVNSQAGGVVTRRIGTIQRVS